MFARSLVQASRVSGVRWLSTTQAVGANPKVFMDISIGECAVPCVEWLQ